MHQHQATPRTSCSRAGRAVLPALLLGGAVLTGCSSGDDAAPNRPTPVVTSESQRPGPTTAAPVVTPTVPVETASGPAFPANTAQDTEEPIGGPLSVVAVRTGRQPGYDRVVFELGGSAPGQPGWTVSYTDQPAQDGSGDPVVVQGKAYLQVILTGIGLPGDTGVGDEVANERFTAPGALLVREVVADSVFEGQFTAFVGLDRKAAFRVFRLANPARVVVDIRHS